MGRTSLGLQELLRVPDRRLPSERSMSQLRWTDNHRHDPLIDKGQRRQRDRRDREERGRIIDKGKERETTSTCILGPSVSTSFGRK